MQNDFSKGKVSKSIMAQAMPMMAAQLVHLLYNVVDRIYIGRMPEIGSMALTGIGVCFPITTIVGAFMNLWGSGGAPIFSIARGAKDEEKAEHVLSQVFSMLILTSLVIFLFSWFFRKPLLYFFGAGDISYGYADQYLRVYLWGTTFAMLSAGLNSFIGAQGYPVIGMLTTVIGAILNLILDPIFIFGLNMGVSGAALATIISQAASCAWVMLFFFGKKSLYRIRKRYLIPCWRIIREIIGLGTANFVMGFTSTAVSIACNSMLRAFGGEIYVGIMTVINSVREITFLPASCVPNGSQPVMGYNYGARKYSRVRQSLRFVAVFTILYTSLIWLAVFLFPGAFMALFSDDPALVEPGARALKIYFFGYLFMSFQMLGQSAFTAMKYSGHAIFFSLLRKAVIVVPLTLLLPGLGLGVDGVFWAEPISNVLGGLACGITMYFTLYRRLPKEDDVPFVRKRGASNGKTS